MPVGVLGMASDGHWRPCTHAHTVFLHLLVVWLTQGPPAHHDVKSLSRADACLDS